MNGLEGSKIYVILEYQIDLSTDIYIHLYIINIFNNCIIGPH